MNTVTRNLRPDLAKEAEEKLGRPLEEFFTKDIFMFMHYTLLRNKNILHVENIGGDIDKVLNRRAKIGAFPWRFRDGEASLCRVVVFLDE